MSQFTDLDNLLQIFPGIFQRLHSEPGVPNTNEKRLISSSLRNMYASQNHAQYKTVCFTLFSVITLCVSSFLLHLNQNTFRYRHKREEGNLCFWSSLTLFQRKADTALIMIVRNWTHLRQYGVLCPTSSVCYLQVASETDDNYLDHSRFAFWCTYGFIETL